jgi:hypothetical protein
MTDKVILLTIIGVWLLLAKSKDREVAWSAGVGQKELTDVKSVGGSRCKGNVGAFKSLN